MSDEFVQAQNLVSTIADAERKAFKDGYDSGYERGICDGQKILMRSRHLPETTSKNILILLDAEFDKLRTY